MLQSLAVFVVLLAIVSTSVSFQAHASERKPSVGIFMDFDAPPAGTAVETMKREVGTIMKPTGLDVDWRLLKENKGNETFDGLIVIRFKGKCRVQPWVDEVEPGDITLGSTLVSEGKVMPFTEINCEQVRKTLPYASTLVCDQERQCALGRALGRVVAHELYHVLAKTTAHAGKGLAKAKQSLRDLVTGSLRFVDEDSEAIRHGVMGRPPVSFSYTSPRQPAHSH